VVYIVGMLQLKNLQKMSADKPERRVKFVGSYFKHSFLSFK